MTDSPQPRTILLDDQGHPRTGLSLEDVNAALTAKTGHLWVDLDIADPKQAEFLKGITGLHPLAVEDALLVNSRPKLEEYDDCLFMIIIGLRFSEGTADPYDLETFDLRFALGSNFLITVHERVSVSIEEVARRIEKNPDLLKRGMDRLTHAIMDGAVDGYFPLLEKIDDFVDTLEQRVVVDFDETALKDIFAVKRLVLSLRKHIAPQRLDRHLPRPAEQCPGQLSDPGFQPPRPDHEGALGGRDA